MEVNQLLVCGKKLKSGASINELQSSDFTNIVIIENVLLVRHLLIQLYLLIISDIIVIVIIFIFIFILIGICQIGPICVQGEHTRRFEFRNDTSTVGGKYLRYELRRAILIILH